MSINVCDRGYVCMLCRQQVATYVLERDVAGADDSDSDACVLSHQAAAAIFAHQPPGRARSRAADLLDEP
ncbi:MAG TPA: hypothetical protein VHM88_12240 [Candidatus Acidoferrales bacterium]|nr:hypothetical protein [Candidatus Acidoferrales bacterium]